MTFSVDYPGNRDLIIGLYTNGMKPIAIAEYLVMPIERVRRVIASAQNAGLIATYAGKGRVIPGVRLFGKAAKMVRQEANRRGVAPARVVADIVTKALG